VAWQGNFQNTHLSRKKKIEGLKRGENSLCVQKTKKQTNRRRLTQSWKNETKIYHAKVRFVLGEWKKRGRRHYVALLAGG